MIRYLIDRGRAPTAQGQAAFVQSNDSPAMLAEVSDAIRDARLVGWDLAGVSKVEMLALVEINRLARRCNTLVVVVSGRRRMIHTVLKRRFSHVLGAL